MIIVKPNAGLANRMRVINSCICLAKKNNQKKINVFWGADHMLQASFDDLFMPVLEIRLITKSLILNYFTAYANNSNAAGSLPHTAKKSLLALAAKGYKYYNDERISPLRFQDSYWDTGHKKVVFNTCEDFYTLTEETNFYHLFKPVENIQNRIDLQVQKFGSETVGIHIRRTDNIQSADVSKTELFLSEVETILLNRPTTVFYLSTDDPEVEFTFKTRFGASIITLHDKDLSRASKKGMEDAVVDLYCLSKTSRILGSYWSSFGYVASLLHNIPLKIIQ